MKSIQFYGKDTLKIFEDYYEDFDKLTQEEKDIISSLTDWEPLSFTVIDDETVITSDSINGLVYTQERLEDYISETLKYVREEMEG